MKENQQARITGLMYVLVIIFAGFSQGYVRGTLLVSDDAIATANNILSSEGLFRIGFTTDLLAFLLDAAISVMFYQMFKSYNKTMALLTAAFRLLAHPAIASINLLNHYMALEILSSDSMVSFDSAQKEVISLFLMHAHHVGYLIAGAFFAVHCFLLGILIYKSRMVPALIGVLMAIAGCAYFMESFGDFLFPGNEDWLALLVGIAAALGEITLAFYLLIKGIWPDHLSTKRTFQ
ncbi:MAG: DUF4386 domain-containing protein [Saprospiraceae bacterium]|nr:DUF4386 domain-containing protein [Saprospiraceae bacterium]